MAYKRLDAVESVSTFDTLIAVKEGKVVQVPDSDFNEHYGIEDMTGSLYSVAKEKADGIIQSVEGDTLVTLDSSDDYIRGLHIYGKSIQDGAPTLDAPIDIVSLGDNGSIDVNVYTNNLLKYPYLDTTKTANGLTFTDLGNGKIIIDGTCTGTLYFRLNTIPKFKGVLHVEGCPAGGSYSQYGLSVDKNGANQVYEYGEGVLVETNGIDEFSLVIVVRKDAVMNNHVFCPKVSICDTDKVECGVYSEQNLNISVPNGLRGIQVTYDRTYQDQNGQSWIGDEIDFEKGVILNRCKQIVCTGEEEWSVSSTYNAYVLALPETSFYGLSSHMVSITAEQLQNGDEGVYLTYSGYLICNVKDKFATLEDFTQWLSTQYTNGTPVTFVYCVEHPVETALSDAEILTYNALRTNYLGTTVFNNVGAHMKMSYNTDTKTYIDNKFEELKALITA